MSNITSSEAAKAVVRRNTEEVQGKGNFDVFEELFEDFVDRTPQPNMTPDKPGVRGLYKAVREAFRLPRSHDDLQDPSRDAPWDVSPARRRPAERSTSRPWTPTAWSLRHADH